MYRFDERQQVSSYNSPFIHPTAGMQTAWERHRSQRVTRSNARVGCALTPQAGNDIESEALFYNRFRLLINRFFFLSPVTGNP